MDSKKKQVYRIPVETYIERVVQNRSEAYRIAQEEGYTVTGRPEWLGDKTKALRK